MRPVGKHCVWVGDAVCSMGAERSGICIANTHTHTHVCVCVCVCVYSPRLALASRILSCVLPDAWALMRAGS
jgi:hypothetical protein